MATQAPPQDQFITSKFTNSQGVLLLRGLFYETSRSKDTVLYTLKPHDHKGFKSLQALYLAARDLTEYQFAKTHLDSYDHWLALQDGAWFKPYADRWRRDLELLLRAEALGAILATAKDDASKNHFVANRYIVEGGWNPKAGKGRPSKKQIIHAVPDMQVEDDFQRILGNA